jgi:hypothetical protein
MKYLLEVIQPDGTIYSSKEYKSLKSIQSDYPAIGLHQLRAVYLHTIGKRKKFLHPVTKELISIIRISPVDNIGPIIPPQGDVSPPNNI